MKKITLAVLTIVLFLVLGTGQVQAADKTYKFVAPILDELDFAFFPPIVQGLTELVEKRTGIKIVYEQLDYSYTDNPIPEILDRINNGEIDLAIVFPFEYHQYLIEKRSLATPAFGMELYGKNTYDICLYTWKADQIKTMEELRGKAWGGTHTHHVRFLLHKNGFEETTKEFFGKRVYVSEANIKGMVKALEDGKIDVFTANSILPNMLFEADKAFADKVSAISCHEYMNNYFFVYNETLDRDVITKLKKIFLNAHRDPDFAGYRNLMTVTRGKFAALDLLDIYDSMKISFVAYEQGWLNENEQFIKENYKKPVE